MVVLTTELKFNLNSPVQSLRVNGSLKRIHQREITRSSCFLLHSHNRRADVSLLQILL